MFVVDLYDGRTMKAPEEADRLSSALDWGTLDADIRADILGRFTKNDDGCGPQRVDALEQKLKKANQTAELHRYDADHALFNDTWREVLATGVFTH